MRTAIVMMVACFLVPAVATAGGTPVKEGPVIDNLSVELSPELQQCLEQCLNSESDAATADAVKRDKAPAKEKSEKKAVKKKRRKPRKPGPLARKLTAVCKRVTALEKRVKDLEAKAGEPDPTLASMRRQLKDLKRGLKKSADGLRGLSDDSDTRIRDLKLAVERLRLEIDRAEESVVKVGPAVGLLAYTTGDSTRFSGFTVEARVGFRFHESLKLDLGGGAVLSGGDRPAGGLLRGYLVIETVDWLDLRVGASAAWLACSSKLKAQSVLIGGDLGADFRIASGLTAGITAIVGAELDADGPSYGLGTILTVKMMFP